MISPDDKTASIAITKELKALFEIAAANRQAAWHQRLITCLPHAIFVSGESDIIFNPAGLTYYNLELCGTNAENDPNITRYTLPELIDTFLINEGVGIAIEARNPEHAIDLSYGDVLGFHLYRSFAEPKEHPFKTDKPRAGIIREGADLLINEVPAEVLPATTISLLEAVMQHFGIDEPKIRLIYLPETEQQELVFSIKADEFTQEQAQALVQKLGWFLPRYYSCLACNLDDILPIIDKH